MNKHYVVHRYMGDEDTVIAVCHEEEEVNRVIEFSKQHSSDDPWQYYVEELLSDSSLVPLWRCVYCSEKYTVEELPWEPCSDECIQLTVGDEQECCVIYYLHAPSQTSALEQFQSIIQNSIRKRKDDETNQSDRKSN